MSSLSTSQPILFSGADEEDAHERGEQPSGPQGEKAAVQQLLAEAKKLAGPLQAIGAITPGSADTLDKLEQALKKLPAASAMAEAVDGLRRRAESAIARYRRERVEAFRRTEAEFIKSARSEGTQVREQAEGWRIGPVELRMKREQAQCQALYNREVVVGWTKISGLQDMERLQRTALDALNKAAIPDEEMQTRFVDAYDEALLHRQKQNNVSPGRVPLLEFYLELRLTLARADLARNPEGALHHVEFPKWAFLYNIDRYRRIAASLPADERLNLQTGSQQESRHLGVLVNGLDPLSDYSVVCFILRS